MNVNCYGILLIFQISLMNSVASRKSNKISKLSENNIFFEKRQVIAVKSPIMESRKKHLSAMHQHVKTQVVPVEESCRSSNFKNQFKLKQIPKCEPRDTVVELISPNGAILTPNVVIVKRCGGMCTGFKRCLAVETKETKFYIKSIQHNKMLCSSISVMEDVKCTCNCLQTPKDCNQFQLYSKEKCSCICHNQSDHDKCIDHQNENMAWDDSTCSCICHERKSCTTGSYWNERECRCVKGPSSKSRRRLLL